MQEVRWSELFVNDVFSYSSRRTVRFELYLEMW